MASWYIVAWSPLTLDDSRVTVRSLCPHPSVHDKGGSCALDSKRAVKNLSEARACFSDVQRFVDVQAEKLILMTDVPGVLRDKDDVSTKYPELTVRQAKELVEEGIIAGGMIPKVQCCTRCIAQGVKATHIIDGRQQHSLLLELLTGAGVGTMITG